MSEIDKDLELADEWAKGIPDGCHDGWRATCKRLADELRRVRDVHEIVLCEALGGLERVGITECDGIGEAVEVLVTNLRAEIERLSSDLAAPREQEPVAWSNGSTAIVGATAHPGFSTPLYAAPGAQPAVNVPEGWESELLDWVSACQSAYHIDNTPGHRFGGLGSNLDENRQSLVEYVRHLIAAPEAKP